MKADAFALLARTEGIIPAIESAHAVAGTIAVAREVGPDGVVVINISGRGDKDMETAMRWFGLDGEPPAGGAGIAVLEAPIDLTDARGPGVRP